MKFTVITLFPEFIENMQNYSIIGRALAEKKIVLRTVNLRDFGLGSYKQVDDKPYGGGAGMLLRVDVVSKAIEYTKKKALKKSRVIMLCPSGKRYDQKKVAELTKNDEIILLCGHYEGFDKRISDYVDEIVSVGDYVLSGGEIPAMVIIDSVARQLPGVLGNEASLSEESFSVPHHNSAISASIEYPQYTRPEIFEGKRVPEILLSGDPKKITAWQNNQ